MYEWTPRRRGESILFSIGCSAVHVLCEISHHAAVAFVIRLTAIARYALLIGACLVWAGVAGIGLNGDDYQYLHSLAPMRGILDALTPWVTHDANPHYFRPLANTTMVLDFVAFGWNGTPFHLTNLLLHMVTTILVYRVGRTVFTLSGGQSLASAMMFAILASHEYNLVVDTARADILVAIFSLATMLVLTQWLRSGKIRFLVLALVLYFCALASKESALFVLPVFGWQIVRQRGRHVRSLTASLAPFALIAGIFFVYHEHFTMTSLTANDVVQSASLLGIAKNALFSLGYLVTPLEQMSALALIGRPMVLLLFALGAALSGWVAIKSVDKSTRQKAMLPIFFTLLTGIPAWLVFERWRLYLPSVGAVVVITLIVSAMMRRGGIARAVAISLTVAFVVLHIYRSIAATAEWQHSTALMSRMKQDMIHILDVQKDRPVHMMLVISPAKLGSAGVLILGAEALGQQAEAERIKDPGLAFGFVDTNAVKVDQSIEVYALDKANGFHGLSVASLGGALYRVAVPRASGIQLVPSGLGMGALRDNIRLSAGDTLGGIVIRKYERTESVETIEFSLRDTLSTPVVFDGEHLRLQSPVLTP